MTHLMELVMSSATDECPTDQGVFDRLNLEFGPFDLDPCATVANAKCARFYTRDDDGLTQSWAGRVWMNPPYGKTIGLWMRKAAEEGSRGSTVVCLVPARVGSGWWREATASASLLRFFAGRLRFGGATENAPFPSALIVFGPLPRRCHGVKGVRCAHCKEWFYPARSNAKTCSDRCRQSRSRRLKRDMQRAS